ncbi:magnesium transporter CorA family protein [Patescibacteria group bacterium]
MSQKQIIKTNKMSWLNILNASEQDISYLKKKFKFNQFDLNDSYAHKHAQRPKIISRPGYYFIVLLFPVFNRKTRRISPAEIDIFITKDHLITLHYNQLQPLKDLFKNCQDSRHEKQIYLNNAPGILLYEILDRLYVSVFPMLDHVSLNISAIEKNIFAGKERQMVHETLVVKRNIVNLRKIMQTHKNILKKLVNPKTTLLGQPEKIRTFYWDLVEYTKNQWDILENQQQTINALEDTNNALVTFKLNDIMRTLTIMSVLIFPLTLFAAIFAMRTDHMPIIGGPWDFWVIISIMAIIASTMLFIFKRKKWF